MNARTGIAALAAAAAFGACSMPIIDKAAIAKAKDTTAPLIALTAPAEGDSCANVVEVRGSVRDTDNEGGEGGVSSLSYELLGTALGGSVKVAADGGFAFIFDASTLGTRFSLVVRAVDWNGNAASQAVSLVRDSASSIPSLAVVSGNKAVTLTWDAVPQTESYDLMYSTNGSLPSAANGTTLQGVSSPCTVDGLPNGSLCVFRLVARPKAGWTESSSDYAMSIPLSPRSLAPQVSGEIGRIRVRWPPISATTNFELQRREGLVGAFEKLSSVSGNEYIDGSVVSGRDYYYRIKPATGSETTSEANAARTALATQEPYLARTFPSQDRSWDIATYGNFAYVAEGTKGFRVFNILDPANPVEIGSVGLPSDPKVFAWTEVRSIAASSSWLCLAGNGPLIVYSLNSSTGSATFQRTVTMLKPYAAASDQGAYAVTIKGNYAYVACLSQGVQVVRLTDGVVLQTFDSGLEANAWNVLVYNDAYVLAQTFSYNANSALCATMLKVYSINATTGQLSAVASLNLGVNCPQAPIAVAGTVLHVAAYQKWVRVSLANPAAPSVLVTSDFPPAAEGIDISGNRCLVFGEYYSMGAMAYEYNIADPLAPVPVASYELPHGGWAGAIKESALLIAGDTAGVHVFSDPRRYARKTGFLRLAGNGELSPFDIETQGNLLALVGQAGSSGLFALGDISDPASPRELSRMGFPGITRAVAISGNTAYVADESDGLRIIDISNPSAPILLKVVGVEGKASGVAVYGDRAYVTNASSRLRIIDISDLSTALLLPDSIQLMDMSSSEISLDGSKAFMQAGSNYAILQCVDLLKPWEGAVSITNINSIVAISGAYAFSRGGVANAVELQVTNVSDPLKPTRVAAAACPGVNGGGALAVSGGYAFAAAWGLGVQRFSVAKPSSPSYLSTISWVNATDVAVDGSRLAVATGYYIDGYGVELWSLAP